MLNTSKERRIVARRVWLLPVVALAFAVAACDGLLDVQDRDVATPESLDGPEAVTTVVAGAVGDFAVAYQGDGGGGGNQFLGAILATGILGDEYFIASNDVERLESDSRNIRETNSDAQFLFSHLHRARVSLDRADEMMRALDPTDRRRSIVQSMSGFVYTVFAEAFCSGVPFSNVVDGVVEYGSPQTTAQVLETALARFTSALDAAIAVGSEPLEHLARLGMARALLNLDRYAEAAEVVEPVPTSYQYMIELNGLTGRQRNEVWGQSISNQRFSVSNREGGNGLPYREVDDPRVLWRHDGPGFDGSTPLYVPLRYPTADTDVPLAEGIDARLIEAEAAMRDGERGAFFNIHNTLRATIGLAPLEDTGQAQAELVDLHFAERAYWLFSTGRRLGDMRRLVRQYGRDQADVFPVGAFFKGGSYGTDVSYPVPISERNNPNFDGCLDQSA